ncbi:hypothetical protein T4B_2712 [Trichinella pseudospiralis]|nr:hypothetical protein T4B_2712 [Trichinella pseudospiralis]KRZ31879.1 hypothetical protein T4C_2203 [Trichinella pseudospiralis]
MRSKSGQSITRSLTIPRLTTLTRGSWSKLYALSIRKATTSDQESVTSKCEASEKRQEKNESATSSNISDQLSAMVKDEENDNTAASDADVEIAQMVGILKKKSHVISPHLWNKRRGKAQVQVQQTTQSPSEKRCQVDLIRVDGEVHCISINRDDFLQPILLACNNESNQQRWLAALREACFV